MSDRRQWPYQVNLARFTWVELSKHFGYVDPRKARRLRRKAKRAARRSRLYPGYTAIRGVAPAPAFKFGDVVTMDHGDGRVVLGHICGIVP